MKYVKLNNYLRFTGYNLCAMEIMKLVRKLDGNV